MTARAMALCTQVDPRLSEVERTILFLNGGQAVQQQVAVRK